MIAFITQFDTNQLVLELQHTDTISQPGNNGNYDHNNEIKEPDYSQEQN
jgi:hypothetical protein